MADDTKKKPRRLAPVSEACDYGKISRTKLYAKINAGVVLAYKRDGETMIDLDTIDDMNDGLPAYIPKLAPHRP